jgi:hypothetical protein
VPGTFTITPQSGPAGSGAVLGGSFQVTPFLTTADDGNITPATIQPGPSVDAWWLETGIGDALALGNLSSTIDENQIAHFSGDVVIPATAALGPHQVAFLISGATDPNCLAFTVTESARQDAYSRVAASLPDTGARIFWPLVATLVSGFGFLFVGRHRSRHV